MPRRGVWPVVKEVRWCPNCNIPLLTKECPLCGGKDLPRVPLSEPCDARLAFERDVRRLMTAYINEFGTKTGFKELLGNSVILLNKAPYFDEMKEVVSDGVQIGRLYFEPLERRWRFRLSKAGALRVLSKDPDVVEKIFVDKKRFIPMDVIRVDREIEPGKQVLLMRRSGRVVGLGYARRGNRVVVHTWWGDDSPDLVAVGSRKSTRIDVLKAHEYHMYVLKSRSVKLVAVMHSKVGKEVVASFSGGKDSLVAMHLTLEAGIEPKVLFNNTGIELPETVDTVHRVTKSFGLELIEASAEERFWDAVYKLGVPGRDYRWCCKVCKLAPLARTVKRLWSNGALNVVGQRAFESIDRARSPSVWRLRWAPQLLNVSPINYWGQMEVWMYIEMNKLDVNPLYFMGYERIGCFMCPASTLAELALLEETHPDIWARWLEVLEYWRKRLDLPREWIDYALWRWHAPARYRTTMAKKLGVVERIDDWRTTFDKMVKPRIVGVERGDGVMSVALGMPIPIEAIEAQLTALGAEGFEKRGDAVVLKWSDAEVEIRGNEARCSYSSESGVERLIDVLKAAYRWWLCVGCRACEANCPVDAFKVVASIGGYKPMVVHPERCLRCSMCLRNCPVADVFVEHVVAPLLFGDPEAWRRPTREHNVEVMKRAKELVKRLGIAPSRAEAPESYAETSSFFTMLESG